MQAFTQVKYRHIRAGLCFSQSTENTEQTGVLLLLIIKINEKHWQLKF